MGRPNWKRKSQRIRRKNIKIKRADLFIGISQSSLLILQPKLGSFQRPQLNNTGYPRFAAVDSNCQLHLKGLTKASVVSSDSKTPTISTKTVGSEFEIELDSGNGGDNICGGDNGEGDFSEDNGNKKMALSMSQKLTLGYAALVGVGGTMGYMKSGSQKSLAAGGISAAVLYYVYTELPTSPVFASTIGLGISAALLGVMGSRFKRSGKVFPAGVVSLVSLVMSGGYLHGIMRSMH